MKKDVVLTCRKYKRWFNYQTIRNIMVIRDQNGNEWKTFGRIADECLEWAKRKGAIPDSVKFMSDLDVNDKCLNLFIKGFWTDLNGNFKEYYTIKPFDELKAELTQKLQELTVEELVSSAYNLGYVIGAEGGTRQNRNEMAKQAAIVEVLEKRIEA